MKEEFDFDKIGKRMPYKAPSGFFEEITERTLAEAERRAAPSPRKNVWWPAMAAAASLLLLLTVGYLLYTPANRTQPAIAHIAITAKDSAKSIMPKVSGEVQDHKHVLSEPIAEAEQKLTEPANTSKPITAASVPQSLDEVLASISDEELLQLATIAESDLYVYEQTFENEEIL